MKLAVISDIHSNLEALNAVLKKCRAEKVDQYICAGDIVGYNANPAECIKLVKSLPLYSIVKGNHDQISISKKDITKFNAHARQAIYWTRKRISLLQKLWLSKLPLKSVLESDNITVVHSDLTAPEKWRYILNKDAAETNFKFLTTNICFCGHSHSPAVFLKEYRNENVDIIDEFSSKNKDEFSFQLKTGYQYIINPGSVGQPRNNDSRASFVIYNSNTGIITRYRVKYDIRIAQEKIYNSDLPGFNADRLTAGI